MARVKFSRGRYRQLRPLVSTAVVAGLMAALPAAAGAANMYSASSPFNQAIPANPTLDASSATMVQGLSAAAAAKGFPLSVKAWTIPAYTATATTPRYDVSITSRPPGWRLDGTWKAAYHTMVGVPIPAGAAPDPDSDGHMSILDPTSGCEYDFYAAHRAANGTWSAKWGDSLSTSGNGIYADGMSTRASGFALAGMIGPAELQAGQINHALVFSYPYTKAGGPVWPATASDGLSTGANAIPMGARVQLDPSLNLSALGLTGYQLTIARALQQYGMILGDTGGALSLFAINPQSWLTNPYTGVLSGSTYDYLSGIPVNDFRVLATGPQSTRTAPAWTYNGCGTMH
jgi:hypothetical protein